jgi:uncharacterized protein (TIGR00645 family)
MRLKKILETSIFGARWILPSFYLVLIGCLIVYAYLDIKEFAEYIVNIKHVTKNTGMLTLIEVIDLTMVANLAKMVATGSWNSFISKDHPYKNENISSGLLKVKISTSMVGVISIALLQRSVEIDKFGNLLTSWDTLYKLGFIDGLFLFSSIILEIVDYMHEKVELSEKKFQFEKYKFDISNGKRITQDEH